MSEITDNLKHFLKVQSLQFDQARIQATKQADDLGLTQHEPRMYFIQLRMDEILGVYSRNNWEKKEIEVYYKNNRADALCYPHCSTAKKFAEQFNEKNYLREKGKTLSRSSLEHIRSLGYTINDVSFEEVSND